MLVKTIYREAKLYRVCVVNPADGLKTPRFKSLTRSFLLGKKLTPLTGVDTTNRFASFAFVHYGCGGFVKKLARVKRDLYEPEKASPEIVVGDSE
jgi:hypothetical protein